MLIRERATAQSKTWVGFTELAAIMANAEQIKGLLRSYIAGDSEQFLTISMQVAAAEARRGNSKLARELRELVDQAKLRATGSIGRASVPMARPVGELSDLVSVSYPKTRLAEMVLSESIRTSLTRVLAEYCQQDRLRSHGLSARRKLLLVGPPGCGKTMTASALAGELKLPLLAVRLDGVITKFMGETAAKLRQIFETMISTRGVYLFDEFDALGGERGSKNDVGEIRRVLNSFLQFLEQDDSDSIVVGATNHVGLLDRALFRRFDAALEYSLPTEEIATRVMRGRLALLETSNIEWHAAAKAAEGLSHAEIAMACEQAAKNAILHHTTTLREADLVSALVERRITHA